MAPIGCPNEGYIVFANVPLRGKRPALGVATVGELTGSVERLWFRNFSSLRHFALRFENQTCKEVKWNKFRNTVMEPP